MSDSTITYTGHGPSGGIQMHSMDEAFAKHQIVMVCVQGKNERRLWQATRHGVVIFSHPQHDKALFGAIAVLVGA